MTYFLVHGGRPLKGSVAISGAKNAAVKMIAAALLSDGEVRLTNVPRIADVQVDLEVVRSLGVKVEEAGSELRLRADEVAATEIPPELCRRTRGAVVTMGALLARFGKATLYTAGGCRIGSRPIDRHLDALRSLGAEITCEDTKIVAKTKQLIGGPIRFAKVTVMGTENAILAATLAKGETTIFGAAQEPEVDDLIALLTKMGARIERRADDPAKIVIQGVESLSGAEHQILPDRNEAVTFAVAAAATRGDVILDKVRPQDLTAFFSKFKAAGCSYDVTGNRVRVWASANAAFTPVDIETAPHPGFMTDWQQPFSVLLTQASGESLVHERVFQQRFDFLAELQKMGVNYQLLTPSAAGLSFNAESYGFDGEGSAEPLAVAKIQGPTKLHGAEMTISDLRAGATLVLAALAAEGESRIFGVDQVDRGYEDFEGKLRSLGAEIERVEGDATPEPSL